MSRPPEDAVVLGAHLHKGKRTDRHGGGLFVNSLAAWVLLGIASLLVGCGAAASPPDSSAMSSPRPPTQWWWQTTFVNGTVTPAALSEPGGDTLAVGLTLLQGPEEIEADTLCVARLAAHDGSLVVSRCLTVLQNLASPVLLERAAGALILVQGANAWALEPETLATRWEAQLGQAAVAIDTAGDEVIVVLADGLQILSARTGTIDTPPTPTVAVRGLLAAASGQTWGWGLERDAWNRPLLVVGTIRDARLCPRWRAPAATDDVEALRAVLGNAARWLPADVFADAKTRATQSGDVPQGACPSTVTHTSGLLRWSSEAVRGHLVRMQRLTVCPPDADAWTVLLPVGFVIDAVTMTPDGSLVQAQTARGWALLEPQTGALVDWLRLPQASASDVTSRVDRDPSLCSIVALHADWGVLQCLLWDGVAYEAVAREQEPTQPAVPAQRRAP